jgi:tripartite ATP-independent transporter DctM subunit
MVIYAVLTEQFVMTLFLASFVPSLIAVALYFLTIQIVVAVRPEFGPAGPRTSWAQRWHVTRNTWGALLLIVLVSGGIYGGVFTVNEAASVGVFLALLLALAKRSLSWRSFLDVLFESAAISGMLYGLIIAGSVFGRFIALTGAPELAVDWIRDAGLPPFGVILAITLAYLVLGCVFDEYGVMVLSLPFVFPLVVKLGYDPIWWGIVNVMVIEIGLILPPIGMNVFVLHSMAKHIPLWTIYGGIMPFFAADMVRLGLLLVFPTIALWLPQAMK